MGGAFKHQFYEMLVRRAPTTSQATPAAFADCFEAIASAGDSAVVITLSSKLSGTYQSAVLAAEDYPNIYVVDSQSVAIGTGVLAQYTDRAGAAVQRGNCTQVLTQQREKVCGGSAGYPGIPEKRRQDFQNRGLRRGHAEY